MGGNMSLTKKLALLCLVAVVAAAWHSGTGLTQSRGRVDVTTDITADATWTKANDYFLLNPVFVRAPATLTIEPGTRLLGDKAGIGTLIVERGAKLIAVGTREEPIVMTSAQPIGTRNTQDWGGLIINGAAPINVPGGEAIGEGDTGAYGGTNPADNSGELRFVRVEFAGIEFSPDNELNGIAFQGVGNGTKAEFVQVHRNKDDGIEFFGGTVDLKYALVTGAADDSFDWTDGWTGRGQFWIAQQYGNDADQGFENDNNGENNDLEPRSNGRVYNFTLVGDPDFDLGDESDIGMLLREGTSGQYYNGIVTGFKEEAVEIDDASTFQMGVDGRLKVDNSIFWRNNGNATDATQFSDDADEDAPFTTRQFIMGEAPASNLQQSNALVDPMLRDPFNTAAPDFRPKAGSPVDSLGPAIPPNDGFFDVALFIGAMGQAKDFNETDPYLSNWLQGWTNYAIN
jgi:hypothetical protein